MSGIRCISAPVASSREHRPFGTGWALPGETGANLAVAGYVEEELIVSGTTDIYDYDDRFRLRTRDRDVPYVTRMLDPPASRPVTPQRRCPGRAAAPVDGHGLDLAGHPSLDPAQRPHLGRGDARTGHGGGTLPDD